mmetsp:Transcript_20568/g.28946  ORF Transcript_20568/g.28946 Transcript_20568/m.28946 type:complete len:367 (+) Transcript_20568:63-1163(+)|eukprot:CAMPEP_0175100536 /NCGR_PEP_ID=MMETSP0086_2-20121207/7177_1 /TAXON_ID=136419 /ORGANISM="Unknown Unknown, Strain D1" /LENGTH=366 /DNA_ID=CAMNT_0016374729 /DNA_START=63 /DNA_END=1163 /DNA_ORIENTATION=-
MDTRYRQKRLQQSKSSKGHRLDTSSTSKVRGRVQKNPQSQSYSRPNLRNTRTANFIADNDMLRHNAIDYNVTETLYRKTAAPRFVEDPRRSRFHPNHQGKMKRSKQGRDRQANLPRAAVLASFNLVVGNAAFAQLPDQELREQYGITGVLSVCETPFSGNLPAQQQPMMDDKSIAYGVFAGWVRASCRAVASLSQQSSKKGRVLVFCQQGVNRSVTIAVGVLMISHGLTYEQAVEAVVRAKDAARETNWHSLTNKQFRQYLQALVRDPRMVVELDRLPANSALLVSRQWDWEKLETSSSEEEEEQFQGQDNDEDDNGGADEDGRGEEISVEDESDGAGDGSNEFVEVVYSPHFTVQEEDEEGWVAV